MGPNPNGPRSVSCDRAIKYSGFFGVRSFVGPTVGDVLELTTILGGNSMVLKLSLGVSSSTQLVILEKICAMVKSCVLLGINSSHLKNRESL